MKLFTLWRLQETESGTPGVLVPENSWPLCLTLERKWLNNKPFESCTPLGEYPIKRVVSPKYGDVFAFQNVVGRDDCLIHWGNFWQNTLGCTLLGSEFEPVMNMKTGLIQDGLKDSRKSFDEFMAYMKSENEGKIVIRKVG